MMVILPTENVEDVLLHVAVAYGSHKQYRVIHFS